jgi:hypothetical protein
LYKRSEQVQGVGLIRLMGEYVTVNLLSLPELAGTVQRKCGAQ